MIVIGGGGASSASGIGVAVLRFSSDYAGTVPTPALAPAIPGGTLIAIGKKVSAGGIGTSTPRLRLPPTSRIRPLIMQVVVKVEWDSNDAAGTAVVVWTDDTDGLDGAPVAGGTLYPLGAGGTTILISDDVRPLWHFVI